MDGFVSEAPVACATFPVPVTPQADGTPVVVVLHSGPVASPDSATPLIFPTTVAPCVPVTSPTSEPEKLAAVVAFATAVVLIAATSAAAVQATGTPVVVVLHSGPLARPDSSAPLMPLTVVAPPVDVLTASPESALNVPEPPPKQADVAGTQVPGFPVPSLLQ